MTHDRNAFKAGLFILLSVVLIIAVVVAIKGFRRLVEPNQQRVAVFKLTDDVGGLNLGDDVRVGGLKVGTVRAIDIERDAKDDAAEAKVIVTFHMPRRLILRQGASVGVQSTLTGSAWLNLDSLGTGKPLAPDARLIGQPSTFTVLTNAAKTLGPEIEGIAKYLRSVTIPKIDKTADNASALAADLRARLDGIVQRYNTVTIRLDEVLTQTRDLLGDSKGDLRGTFANVNSATAVLKDKLPSLMDQMDQVLGKVTRSLDGVQTALADVSKSAENARVLTGSARSLLVGNKGKIQNIISSVKVAGDNLRAATSEVRRSPWRLLYKPRPNEMANLNLFDAARQFAEGASDLNDASTALKDALDDPQANPAQVRKLLDRLDESFAGFKKVETDLWDQVKQ
jgi:phospholipid/cholesterol/gamma-HCH transport system substrate-binding protein